MAKNVASSMRPKTKRCLRRRLPPGNALVVFEAAARLGGFSKAGKELCITQAAVSKQIKVMEDNLGVILFRRHPNLRLTAQGAKLHQAVNSGLNHIAGAIEQMRPRELDGSVHILCTHAFSTGWLARRLPQFMRSHRHIRIKATAQDSPVLWDCTTADLAVCWGHGDWPEVESVALFEDIMIPVCSSQFRRRHGPFQGAPCIARQPLVHLENSETEWMHWREWLSNFGAKWEPEDDELMFNNFASVLEAVAAHQGIALASMGLVGHELAGANLVPAAALRVPTGCSFYCVWPKARRLSSATAVFRDWLMAEGKAESFPGGKKPSNSASGAH